MLRLCAPFIDAVLDTFHYTNQAIAIEHPSCSVIQNAHVCCWECVWIFILITTITSLIYQSRILQNNGLYVAYIYTPRQD